MIPKHKSYRHAFEVAVQEIRSLDPQVMADRSGCTYRKREDGAELILNFFGVPHTVIFPEVEILSPLKKTISLVTKIILLHYLIRADGTAERNDLVPYKEVPGGLMYAGVFERRVAASLITAFGQDPQKFLRAGVAMGGESQGFGDVSFLLRVLPRVSVTFVLWQGDDEFPPSIQILFDRSIDRYLSLEDIVVLGEMIAKRLIARRSRGR
jgi:hypothetical protein